MSYVYAGYGLTIATLALYAARTVLRERSARRILAAGGGAGPWR